MKSIVFLFAWFSLASAAAPGSGLPLVPANPEAFAFVSDGPRQALADIVPVAGQPFENAWRIDVLTQPPAPWKVQLTTRSAGPVKRGDIPWARLFLRCTASLQESGEGRLTLFLNDYAGLANEGHDPPPSSIHLQDPTNIHYETQGIHS